MENQFRQLMEERNQIKTDLTVLIYHYQSEREKMLRYNERALEFNDSAMKFQTPLNEQLYKTELLG